MNSYHQEINSLYDGGKLDDQDTAQLNSLNNSISHAYSEGKINNEQIINLKNETSVLYYGIFKKRIDSLSEPFTGNVNREDLLHMKKEDIIDAHSKGTITQLQYNLLNERITG